MKAFRSVLLLVLIASFILVVLSTTPQSILWRIEGTAGHAVDKLGYYYRVGFTTIQDEIANCKGFLDKRSKLGAEEKSLFGLPETLYSYFKNTVVLQWEQFNMIGGIR